MPAKSTSYASDLLKLLFNGTPIANVADNAASSPLTNISIALHTADPGVGGTQSTSECAYTSYARVSVARSAGGFTVTGASASPVAAVTFPACTAGSETATYWSAGVTGGGGTKIFYRGPITPNIVIAAGVTPQVAASTTVTES